jgi:hypothetical protein
MMADTAQVIYEYSDGNSVSFFTEDLSISWDRPGLNISVRVDKTIVVTDTDASQRVFTCTAVLTGANVKTMNDVQTAAITYSGAYPRLTTVQFDGGGTNKITNVEVALTKFQARDMGHGYWMCSLEFKEKDQ